MKISIFSHEVSCIGGRVASITSIGFGVRMGLSRPRLIVKVSLALSENCKHTADSLQTLPSLN
jgi:hypothetical protein